MEMYVSGISEHCDPMVHGHTHTLTMLQYYQYWMDFERAGILGNVCRDHSGSQIRASSCRELHMTWEKWTGFYVVGNRGQSFAKHSICENHLCLRVTESLLF